MGLKKSTSEGGSKNPASTKSHPAQITRDEVPVKLRPPVTSHCARLHINVTMTGYSLL